MASRSTVAGETGSPACAAAAAARTTRVGSVAGFTAAGQHGFAFLLDDAVGQRGALRAADQPAADLGDRPLRPAQRAIDPVPGHVAGVVDRPRDGGDVPQQHVPVVQPEFLRDGVLVLHLQPVGGPAGQALQHVTDVQQRRPRLLQPLVRAVGDPGGRDGPHHHQVAQPTAGFLEIGGGREGQRTGAFGPLVAALRAAR